MKESRLMLDKEKRIAVKYIINMDVFIHSFCPRFTHHKLAMLGAIDLTETSLKLLKNIFEK